MQPIQKIIQDRPPIIAVITIEDPLHSLPIAEALQQGGVTILEITLRSEHGLNAIKSIRAEFPQLCVGVGTITESKQFSAVKKAGAQFAVSPGLTLRLVEAAKEHGIPFLPGAITPSEILTAMELGLEYLKFFPAESSGGTAVLKDFSGPFQKIQFCPTGGINDQNIQQYLNLDSVFCAGTTWLTAKHVVQENNWQEITNRARTLVSLTQ